MGLGLSFDGGSWWAVGCGGTVDLGLSLVGLLGVSRGGFVIWWLLVVLLMVGGACVVDDGSVGGDWKFWVDRWVALFLMVG